jgi:uncharacterized protein
MKKAKREKYSVSHTWYKRFKKRFLLQSIGAWINLVIGIIISLFLVFVVSVGISNYNASKENIAELKEERAVFKEEMQRSLTADQKGKFEQTQKELTSSWENDEENYVVTIDGKELMINRNNIFVSDNAKVLKDETKQKIYQMNKEFSQFNEGQQLMVVTIQSLPKSATIESFATEVFNQLGIGQAGKDNGILYLMSIKDRKTRIEVGYGLESTVTDYQAGSILDDEDTVSDFKSKAYDKGTNRIVDQLYSYIGSITPEHDWKIKEAEEDLGDTRMVIIVLIVILLICLGWGVLVLLLTKKLKHNLNQLSKEEIYYLYLATPIFIFTTRKLKAMIETGKVMSKHKGAKRKGKNILVGNRLYNSSGYIITRDYASYSSSSSNGSSGWSSSGGDSFGGGSSGGGGASGGW